jgi:hypothetical protein
MQIVLFLEKKREPLMYQFNLRQQKRLSPVYYSVRRMESSPKLKAFHKNICDVGMLNRGSVWGTILLCVTQKYLVASTQSWRVQIIRFIRCIPAGGLSPNLYYGFEQAV